MVLPQHVPLDGWLVSGVSRFLGPDRRSPDRLLSTLEFRFSRLSAESLRVRLPSHSLSTRLQRPSEAVGFDRRQLVKRRLKDVMAVMGLHEVAPVGGRAAGRRDWNHQRHHCDWYGNAHDHRRPDFPERGVTDPGQPDDLGWRL